MTQIDMRSAVECSVCNKPLHKDCAIKDGGAFFCDVCYTVKQEEGAGLNKTDFEIPSVIRRSHIELYRDCPYAFYLDVIKQLPSKQSSFAQIGIDLHELFQKASEGSLPDPKSMKIEYKKIWDKYKDGIFEPDLILYKDMNLKKFKDKMWKQVNDAVDTFYHVLAELPKNALALEQNIVFNIGHDLPDVSITMDRVDEINGELYIRDWKTGSVMIGQKLSSDLQAPLYIYAVKEHFKKTVNSFTFYYLPENKQRIFNRIDDENYECYVNKKQYKINITDSIRTVQSVFSHIKKGEFNIPKDARKMYFTCKTCSYKRDEVCKGADLESWRQYNGGQNK
jgi:RecB family exonuclease